MPPSSSTRGWHRPDHRRRSQGQDAFLSTLWRWRASEQRHVRHQRLRTGGHRRRRAGRDRSGAAAARGPHRGPFAGPLPALCRGGQVRHQPRDGAGRAQEAADHGPGCCARHRADGEREAWSEAEKHFKEAEGELKAAGEELKKTERGADVRIHAAAHGHRDRLARARHSSRSDGTRSRVRSARRSTQPDMAAAHAAAKAKQTETSRATGRCTGGALAAARTGPACPGRASHKPG